MPEIFINYRTIDGKEIAYRIYDELTRRFGEGRAFLAGQSIPKGDNYESALDRGVRRSEVLLVLIGSRWLDAPERDRPDRRALDNEQDWVRREIEEAIRCGLVILPVLIGRHVEQLDARRLPSSIAPLAECQYTRFALRTAAHDLRELGDELVRIVPDLATTDRDAPAQGDDRPRPGDDGNDRRNGSADGASQFSTAQDNSGTLIGTSQGPVHSGTGDLVLGNRVSGDTYHGDRIGTQVRGDQVNGDQVAGGQVKADQVNGQVLSGGQGDASGSQLHFGPVRNRDTGEDA
ncbi:toll/interleukin-1 receptor domain-containing protein [Streptomyces sp. NBRC 109706]|uniref:toll/interleukin-1 receptor domain-containing protein n=1 Tax=Streptomyces sp. NBRC 109706 TaxID=1550035 RepID=UPI0007864323|nr:toll/interleukin-1 receptor domain-containing protein [Streptomyces sp. NBRC 109706]